MWMFAPGNNWDAGNLASGNKVFSTSMFTQLPTQGYFPSAAPPAYAPGGSPGLIEASASVYGDHMVRLVSRGTVAQDAPLHARLRPLLPLHSERYVCLHHPLPSSLLSLSLSSSLQFMFGGFTDAFNSVSDLWVFTFPT